VGLGVAPDLMRRQEPARAGGGVRCGARLLFWVAVAGAASRLLGVSVHGCRSVRDGLPPPALACPCLGSTTGLLLLLACDPAPASADDVELLAIVHTFVVSQYSSTPIGKLTPETAKITGTGRA
jgi:hypothetical protein